LRTYKTAATVNTLEKWKRTPNQRQSAASLGNIQGVCTPAQKPSRLFKTSDSQVKDLPVTGMAAQKQLFVCRFLLTFNCAGRKFSP
jgi:hypothetical protein